VKNVPKVPAKIFDDYFQSLDLDEDQLVDLAKQTGWQTREPRKITAAALLSSLCIESVKGEASFNDLSSRMDLTDDRKGPSSQAVSKRINPSFRKLLEILLARLIKHKVNHIRSSLDKDILPNYRRVLLQDSTVIRLPTWLFEHFSGVSNKTHRVCNARIQVVYDLKEMAFVSFEICPYSKNDLKAAPELIIQKGDLVLRDRGYLTMGEIARHIDEMADCIYRHKSDHFYLDPLTGERIDLLTELRKHGTLDLQVCLNDKARTRVRLVAAPVDQKTADLRRMKARKESSSKNPSKETLALMGWTILLTTVPKENATFETLLKTYGLRWGIEMIFKAWKSQLHFGALHRVSKVEMETILTVRLMLITEGTNVLYRRCYLKIKDFYDRDLSLQKFLRRLSRMPELFGLINDALAERSDESSRVWQHLLRYCCYDKRTRKNFFDQCRDLS
jgi:hypothetical protein